MNSDAVYELIKTCLIQAALVAGPFVILALLVGTVVTVLQTLTSVQEQTLTFVPKLLAAGLCLWLLAPWILGRLTLLLAHFFGRAAEIGRP